MINVLTKVGCENIIVSHWGSIGVNREKFTCDYYQWISMIKTLYFRRNQRMSQGKKVTALDEKYLKAVENELYSELALTLGMTKTEVLAYMKERIC